MNLKNFIKKAIYNVGSNIFSLIASALFVFILPKLVGIEIYSYYQLYLFYIGYVGVTNLGFNEGILLREAGKKYSDLEYPLYNRQIKISVLINVIIYLFLIIISIFNSHEYELVTFICVFFSAIFINPRYIIQFILQATGRIKEYANILFIEKITSIILLFILLFFQAYDLLYILLIDILSKIVSLVYGMYQCKEIFNVQPVSWKIGLQELFINMRCGIKMMMASLCTLLIIGVIRFGIEQHWDIVTFGKVSLTITISNLIVQFLNAIAIVMYSALRRIASNELTNLYKVMRIGLSILALIFLVAYYPMTMILSKWLPQYMDSLRYAAILFPICFFESRMSILIQTYFQTLRLEKSLLYCNIVSLILSIICSIISMLIFDNLLLSIFCIVFVLGFRVIACEIVLHKRLSINMNSVIIMETIMIFIFIISNSILELRGFYAYLIALVLFVIIMIPKFKNEFNYFKKYIS